ncbi:MULTISPECIES: DUF1330 domain-containing protein [unclassified Prochlorococcus]|uniref:DUF1330 domain-containing protein n=1 Tax=unclassified Prochlorococcus TaxID=2627481 RepID=UPI0005337CBB|nr:MULTISPECIES: DUF1330 domain-containing protein [unclassified Prochlorococcus]KGG27769.1 hypothetical protein EV13_1888 [Prochlorococcus sp. MIT 0702]KGG29645.1 hypothetical protein EV12_0056 [Prochlorococcus sp. MIT 0701]KGG34354.1 hypothetical protein EV14_1248 [Prochlorococcus sp. MIT 0703]
MAKGYWLINSTVTNPEGFAEYAKAVVPWINSVGGRIIAKDLESDIREGLGGQLGVIIEFPSKQDAQKAYEAPEYQEVMKLRLSNSSGTTLSIIEGLI